jgi:hypothetical protein
MKRNSPLQRCFFFLLLLGSVCTVLSALLLYTIKKMYALSEHYSLTLHLHVPEHVPVDDICVVSARGGWPCRGGCVILVRFPTGEGDVELTVGKYRGRQVDCDLFGRSVAGIC